MMSSKRCPKCSKEVTNFSNFLTSVKTIQCQNCGTKLKLGSKMIYLLLLMVILGLAVPTFLIGINDIGFGYFSQAWMTVGVLVGYLAVWYVLTSALAWKVVEFELPGDKI